MRRVFRVVANSAGGGKELDLSFPRRSYVTASQSLRKTAVDRLRRLAVFGSIVDPGDCSLCRGLIRNINVQNQYCVAGRRLDSRGFCDFPELPS